MADFDLVQLEKFLYNSNKNGYAGDGKEVLPPQRPCFSEIEYREGDWIFHDSYCGHFFAPGQEVVYYQNKPVWAMAYAGGMKFEYHGNEKITHEVFIFLKKALMVMDPKKPFRGPAKFKDGEFEYVSILKGDIKDFVGNEKILQNGKLVFEQNFIGGIIVGKL